MSHLHIADGILPLWLWGGSLAVVAVLAAVFSWQLQRRRRMVPVVGVLAAVALVIMQVHIGPFHINLSALAGIVAGPGLGFLAVLVANFFSAMLLGHGGITVLGVNSLLVGSEALVAGTVFALLGGPRRLLVNGAVAVVLALLVSSALVLATAAVAGQSLEAMVEGEHHHQPAYGHDLPGGSRFLARFARVVGFVLLPWLAAEMALSLGAMGFVCRVRGQWFDRGE